MKNQPPRFYGGNLKTKKINNMPLGPKQQPPYYIPEPLPTPGGDTKFIRQYANQTQVPTSGTTETTLYTYTLPADLLTQNGDGINLQFAAHCTGTGTHNHVFRYYVATILQNSYTFNNNGFYTLKVQLVRKSTTELMSIMQSYLATEAEGEPTVQIEIVDFTTTIPILISAQAATDDTIYGLSITLDKELK